MKEFIVVIKFEDFILNPRDMLNHFLSTSGIRLWPSEAMTYKICDTWHDIMAVAQRQNKAFDMEAFVSDPKD